jgi:tryptophan synthase beta chain
MQNKKYGEFGGQYVSESLMNTLKELEAAYNEAIKNPKFWEEYDYYMKDYVGRENPLYFASKLSSKYGPKIYLKREDLNHTGAHKINNVIGQILLAKRMGKKKVIAETGAGQHGVATATGAALFDMQCKVYMGTEDIERQKLNVLRMEMLGAKVVPVTSGSNTLKDATNEAIRTWSKEAEDTFYVLGSALGPHPYPEMVKNFQSIISKEAKKQILEKEGRLPSAVVACCGGGSNSIGMFAEFIDEPGVKLYGVEAAGKGIETGEHAAAMSERRVGVLHGMRSYLLQDEDGNINLAYSISAGLDYPGIGPEHAYLDSIGRVTYDSVTDTQAMEALLELCRLEGIIPAIESAHALAYLPKLCKTLTSDDIVILCLSGRGDKDVNTIAKYIEDRGDLDE